MRRSRSCGRGRGSYACRTIISHMKLSVVISLFCLVAWLGRSPVHAGEQSAGDLNLIFIGNSITQGALLRQPAQEAPPAVTGRLLEQEPGIGRVQVANLGVSGSTTVDWLPDSGSLFSRVVEAGDRFVREDATLIFSIMLGTNDSAVEGPNGAPVGKSRYVGNLSQIIDSLARRYPRAHFVLHHPLWYSANTYNGARYLQEGQDRLRSYIPGIDSLIDAYRSQGRNYLHRGATRGWRLFEREAAALFTPETGLAGTFYLHPNKEGAERLARLWEEKIYDLYRRLHPRTVALSHEGACVQVYPAERGHARKAVLICPGGGYGMVAVEHEGTQIARWLSRNGITAVVLKYRLPEGNPRVPLADAAEALGLIRRYREEWGGYTQIGIMGSSAGGHLASALATRAVGDTALDFQILLYPVISMEPEITHAGSRINLLGNAPSQSDIREFSNELRVTGRTPRAFMALSADDTGVPVENSLRYFDALRGHGIPVSMHIYPDGGHGWGFRPDFRRKTGWHRQLLLWLDTF